MTSLKPHSSKTDSHTLLAEKIQYKKQFIEKKNTRETQQHTVFINPLLIEVFKSNFVNAEHEMHACAQYIFYIYILFHYIF